MGFRGYPNTTITNQARGGGVRGGGVPVTLDNAWSNVIQLMSDAGIIDFEMVRADEDVDDGHWPFEIRWADQKAFIWMPGLPLEKLKVSQKSVTYFVPRLSIDGNTWLWEYAVEILSEKGKDEEQT